VPRVKAGQRRCELSLSTRSVNSVSAGDESGGGRVRAVTAICPLSLVHVRVVC